MTIGAVRGVAGTAFLLLFSAAAFSGQEEARTSFVERVNVNVRSVLVVVTDRSGGKPAAPPGIADLEILENGLPWRSWGSTRSGAARRPLLRLW